MTRNGRCVMTQTETYDPMIYDVMRESANRLVGEYMYLAHLSLIHI